MFLGATFDNQTVKAKYDGGLYGSIHEDGRLRGCAMTTRPNQVVIAPGMLICCGRVIPNEGSHTVDVLNPTDGYMRLVLQIDLGAEASGDSFEQVGTQLQYQQTEQFPPLVQEDINDGGKVYQMEMGVFRIEDGQIVETVREMAPAKGSLAAQLQDKANKGAQIEWTDMVLLNNFRQFEENTRCKYGKDEQGRVWLSALLTRDAIPTSNQPFMQLPVGFRPAERVWFAAANGTWQTMICAEVNGDVRLSMSTVSVSTADKSFPVSCCFYAVEQ